MIQAGSEAEVELDRVLRLEQAGILEVLGAVSESKTKVFEPAEAEGQEREREQLACGLWTLRKSGRVGIERGDCFAKKKKRSQANDKGSQ